MFGNGKHISSEELVNHHALLHVDSTDQLGTELAKIPSFELSSSPNQGIFHTEVALASIAGLNLVISAAGEVAGVGDVLRVENKAVLALERAGVGRAGVARASAGQGAADALWCGVIRAANHVRLEHLCSGEGERKSTDTARTTLLDMRLQAAALLPHQQQHRRGFSHGII